MQAGAGLGASIADADYAAAGAEVCKDPAKGADIVLGVQGPNVTALKGANKGAWIVAGLDPFGQRGRVDEYAKAGFEALAMELTPTMLPPGLRCARTRPKARTLCWGCKGQTWRR